MPTLRNTAPGGARKQPKKGNQKVADQESRIAAVFALPTVTIEAMDAILQEGDHAVLGARLTAQYNALKLNSERDAFTERWDAICAEETKNQTWENNHRVITNYIFNHLDDFARFPSQTTIAAETGLSRKTVSQHLKDFNTHPLYKMELQKFRYMYDRVLGKVAQQALRGDIKACRLYLETVGTLTGIQAPASSTVNNYTQNLIYIGPGMAVTQEMLNTLPPAAQAQIQALILKASQPIHHKK